MMQLALQNCDGRNELARFGLERPRRKVVVLDSLSRILRAPREGAALRCPRVRGEAPMSVDLAWYLPETALSLVDVRVALADVAARHPGVVVRRELNVGAMEEEEEVPREDLDDWDEGIAFFKVGFPASLALNENVEGAGPTSGEGGLAWGDILFSRGSGDDEGGEDDGETGASMLISSKLGGAAYLWSSLLAFADEAAVELGARSQEDVDAGIPAPVGRPLTWAQIRMWIRGGDADITEDAADHLSVVLHGDHDDRSQRVTLTRETHLDRPWLRLTREVDEARKAQGEALVQDTTISRSEADGLFYLVQRIPFTAVTKSLLGKLLADLGAEAVLAASEGSSGLDVH
jgi:hypothetical protein